MEYPKIETLFDRGPDFKVVPGALRKEEFGLVGPWLVTEKVDGTNIRVRYEPADPERLTSAVVTYAGRTDRAQLRPDLLEYLRSTFPPKKFAETFDPGAAVILFGEGYGPGIQSGGKYRADGPAFRLFDVRVGDWWLNWSNVQGVAAALGVKTVPVMATGLDVLDAVGMVGNRLFSDVAFEEGTPEALAEGIVARTDPLLFDRRGDRVMWKLKARDL